VWPQYLSFQDGILDIITATIERGKAEGEISPDVDADTEANLIVGSAQMLAQMKFTNFPAERLQRLIVRLVETAVGSLN